MGICNNLVLGISMAAVCEGHALGSRLGLDPKVLADILNTSSGRCWSSDTYNPCPGVMEGVPSARGYTGGFACDLMAKDLGSADVHVDEPAWRWWQRLFCTLRVHREAGEVV